MDEMKREHVLTVTLTSKEHEAMRRQAKSEERSMAQIARRALALYLAQKAAPK